MFPVQEDLGVEKIWFNDTQDAVEIVSKYVDRERTMGVDKNWPARFLLRLIELKGGSTFVNGSSILDRVRRCKDENEINLMREASKINDVAVGKMIKLIPKMYSEKKMAQILLGIYEELGVEGYSFEPIVAYGANGADPHHLPDNS